MRNVRLFFAVSIFVAGTSLLSVGQCFTKDDAIGGSWENSDAEVRCSGYNLLAARLIPKVPPRMERIRTQPEVLIITSIGPVIHEIWDPVPESKILSRTDVIKDLAIDDKDRLLRRRV